MGCSGRSGGEQSLTHLKSLTKRKVIVLLVGDGRGQAKLEEDVKNLFSQAGEVTSVQLITDAATGRLRGFGFVEMASNEEAQALYRKYGLIEVGTRRGYYMDNKEDAVIMPADKITSPSYKESLENIEAGPRGKMENQLSVVMMIATRSSPLRSCIMLILAPGRY